MLLYKLSEEINRINELLEDTNCELTDEQKEEIRGGIKLALEDESTWIAKYLVNLKSNIESGENEKRNLDAIIKSEKNKLEKFNELVYETMSAIGLEKLKTPIGSISKNKRKSVSIPDESVIPEKYKTKKIEILVDKKGIGEVLKQGEEIEGASLYIKPSVTLRRSKAKEE
ncbi:siphovirus Gp157 family protein [Peptostreptococcus faecalis]|uniref:siphovirus Gp157 family protein n=1 Tax=Peptostreptococcus faecalis TaxID=2045015 RepID=UPI000C7C88D4|nr:siphovirus Gp157 family protein [Peptostreptococcus faecalis]